MRSIGQGLEPAATGPRERVLGEAFILFYVQGIRAVGIDLLIAQSGIAKASFYRHFPSKNDLVVAYVERRSEALLTWLAGRIEERASTAPDRLLAIFDALGDLFDDPEYRGCPIINVVADSAMSLRRSWSERWPTRSGCTTSRSPSPRSPPWRVRATSRISGSC
jgi:AcrR family transcriptional regulator